jgi:diacylglycerol kinase (ATP)
LSTAEVCVIYNPAAGRGRAGRRLNRLRSFLGSRADFRPTEGPNHAEELARKAACEGYAVVGAAGGDGTVHEVANGLLSANRSGVRLAVYPVGSANDYAHALGLSAEWWLHAGPTPRPRSVDVGLVQDNGGRQRYFINGLGLGFNGAVTLESQRIQRLHGVLLYGLAMLRALRRHFHSPVMSVAIDGRVRRVATLALSVAIGRREGNFVVAPDALVDDGWFDYLHAGAVSRWDLLRRVPQMIAGGLRADHPLLWTGRCREVRVQSESALTVHLDGEMFCRPEDGLQGLEIRILPQALEVCH